MSSPRAAGSPTGSERATAARCRRSAAGSRWRPGRPRRWPHSARRLRQFARTTRGRRTSRPPRAASRPSSCGSKRRFREANPEYSAESSRSLLTDRAGRDRLEASRWGADVGESEERGTALNAYAAVASQNPYGLTALRLRGIKYVWVTISLAVLVGMYAGPIAAVIKQPSVDVPVAALPKLAIPNAAPPLLSVPKVHALPALPPLRAASRAHATVPPAKSPATTRKVVRHKVPVVSDKHTQVAASKGGAKSAPKDPFASAPVVDDQIGLPVALPAAASDATAPAAAPPADTTTAAPATPDQTVPAQDDATPDAAPATGPARHLQQFDVADPPSTTTTTSPDSATTPTDATPSVTATDAATTATDATTTTATTTDAAPSTTAPPPPPAAPVVSPTPVTAAAPTAPTDWAITSSDGGAHVVSAGVNGANLVVTIDGTATSKSLSDVASLTIVGGAGADSFTVDASLASAGIAITFDGAAGADTLNGPATDTTWTVDGAGSGSVGGVAFRGFENVTGAAGNKDTFTFGTAATLEGVVEGGAGGYDTVVVAGASDELSFTNTGPQSGTIRRGGQTIAYSGMEPVSATSGSGEITVTAPDGAGNTLTVDNDGAGNTRVSCDPSCGETAVFVNPTTKLTIQLGSGGQSVIVNAPAAGFGAAVEIHGGSGNDSVKFNAKVGGGTYSFDGGAGIDTILGADVKNLITVTGIDAGVLLSNGIGSFDFVGTESVTGGSDIDGLAFGPNGALSGTIADGTGDVEVALGGFVYVKGSLAFTKSQKDLKLAGGADVTGADVYTAELTGGTLFAGANHGGDHEVGFSATAATVGVAIVVESGGGRIWHAVKATAAGELVGTPLITFSSSSLGVVYNGTAGDGSAIDFSATAGTPNSVAAGSTSFDGVAGADAAVSALQADISLFNGFLAGQADFTFHTQTLLALDLGGATPEDAQLATFSLSNTHLSIGTATDGVQLEGSLAGADLTPATGTTDAREWFAVRGSALGGSITFGDALSATISGGTLELNQASDGEAVRTDWAALTGGLVTLTSGATVISGDLT